MSSINKSNFTSATYSFIPTNNNLSETLDLADSISSTSTPAIDRKRKAQSVASSVFRNNQNEARPFKRAKISNAKMMSSSRNNNDPAAGMTFIPAPSFRSSLFKINNPIINDEWCSFSPNIGATRVLEQIEAGTLNVSERFPNNNFEITNEEWELLEPLLPPKIEYLDHPRGFINRCIENLLHEKISNSSLEAKDCVKYYSPEKKDLFLKLENNKNDLYETKYLICMYLTRFYGFLSTKYKINDIKSPYNIKNIFNEDLNKLVKNYFTKHNCNSIKKILSFNFSKLKNITVLDIRFLIYLGVGAGFNNGLRRTYNSKFEFNRQHKVNYLNDIIINTNIVSFLNDYVRENCPELKKYWMPHLI